MKKFIKFPEIEQFRNVIKIVQLSYRYKGKDAEGNAIYDPSVILPTLTFTGTVKCHGTNFSVAQHENDMWVQARQHIITPEHDNAGGAFFVELNKEVFKSLFEKIRIENNINKNSIINIYGEFCGRNIQKGVAISQLEKMLVIFGVKITSITDTNETDTAYWLIDDQYKNIHSNENRIYNIHQFKTYSIDVDFNYPEKSQNELIRMTEEVEACCPVGKYFGVEGIGEGLVLVNYNDRMNRICFKSKGEKHSASKVKKLAEVDVEKMNSVNEFVNYSVTENRFLQGIEYVFTQNSKDPDVKCTGEFLKWVVNDIIKEEIDVIKESGLEIKDFTRNASTKARIWFIEFLNKKVGL